jgi:hypothetical protein
MTQSTPILSTEARTLARNLSANEREALLSFSGYRDRIPNCAWVNAVAEDLYAKRLIVGESDSTPTPLGLRVAACLVIEPRPSGGGA